MKYIIAAGYYGSGSSAVIDLLKEIENFHECGAEIRFIKDPYGLYELEQNIVNSWDIINSSNAAWDFLDQSKKWCRNNKTPFSPAGMSYKKLLNHDFYKLSQNFINSLKEFDYIMDSYSDCFKKSYFRYITDRMRRYLEKKLSLPIANRKCRKNIYLHPTIADFEIKTKLYIDRVFAPFFEDSGDVLLLDQAISARHPELIDRYFSDAKLILVDRDPRDIFVDNAIHTDFLDKNLNSIDFAKKFCALFKSFRENKYLSENIYSTTFEKLVLNYEKEKDNIFSFLNINPSKHTKQKEFFNPDVSRNNICLWKKHYSKYKIAIDFINNELKEYIYEKE